jgi:hypothetical protein
MNTTKSEDFYKWKENSETTEAILETLSCPEWFEDTENNTTLVMLEYLALLKFTRNEYRAEEWMNRNGKFRAKIFEALNSINPEDITESASEAIDSAGKIITMAIRTVTEEGFSEYYELEWELSDALGIRDRIEFILAGSRLALNDWIVDGWLDTDGKDLKDAIAEFDKKVKPEVWRTLPLIDRKSSINDMAPEYRNALPWWQESLTFPDTDIVIEMEKFGEEFFRETEEEESLAQGPEAEAEVIVLEDYRTKPLSTA